MFVAADEKKLLESGVTRSRLATTASVSILSVGAFGAALLAVASLWLWVQTVRSCLETYVWHKNQPLLLVPESTREWWEIIVALDLSSCSALIALLFFSALAFYGIRNYFLLPLSERGQFRTHAYTLRLFPEGFGQLCVRLGLIGTLLSLLLTAINQLGEIESGSPGRHDQRVAQTVEMALESEREGVDTQTDPSQARPRGATVTRRESQPMFLLLCASLVSTLVGTFVAYICVPPLEWLNARALGQHLIPTFDAQASARRLCDSIDRTASRLDSFSTLLDIADQLGQRVESFALSFTGLESQLNAMIEGMNTSSASLKQAVTSLSDLGNHLEGTVRELSESNRQLTALPQAIQTPIEQLEAVTNKAMTKSERLFEQLEAATNEAMAKLENLLGVADYRVSALARTMQKPVELIRETMEQALRVVSRIRENVDTMSNDRSFHERSSQRIEGAFGKLHHSLQGLANNVAQLVESEEDARQQQSSFLLAANLLSEMNQRLIDLDGAFASTRDQLDRQEQFSRQFVVRVERLEREIAASGGHRPRPRILRWLAGSGHGSSGNGES